MCVQFSAQPQIKSEEASAHGHIPCKMLTSSLHWKIIIHVTIISASVNEDPCVDFLPFHFVFDNFVDF